MKIMIWNAARGGMRSVVESYIDDGLIDTHAFRLIHAYLDATFATRQLVLCKAIVIFSWCLATKRVELVHIHAAMKGSFWRKSIFARLARLKGVPVVFHLHGSEMKTFFRRQRPWVQSLIARELERASTVVVLSESWRTYIEGIAPNARIAVVPNYVTLGSQTVHIDNAPNLLFLGAIGQRKGIFDLLEALAEARKRVPGLRLLVGGTGQLAEAKSLATSLGLDNEVEFLGWVDAKGRAKLLAEAGVYCLPSYNEGLPMSVLEAMGSGLAVITTDVGGLPELITDGHDGLLIAPGDRDALAEAIVRLASDPEERRRMGQAARVRVGDSYSRDVAHALLGDIYAKVGRAAGHL